MTDPLFLKLLDIGIVVLMGVIGFFLKALHSEFKKLTETVGDIQRTIIRAEGEMGRKVSLLEQAQMTLREQLLTLRQDHQRATEKLDFFASGGALKLSKINNPA